MNITKNFSDEDLGKIKQKIQEAESKISGEIVPVFADKCGNYNISLYRGGIIASLTAFLFLILADRFIPALALYDPIWYFLLVISSGMLAILLIWSIAPLKRIFIGKKLLHESAQGQANIYFLQEEVFNTENRTGIMIFISFFERQVIIKADKGISNVVHQSVWDELIVSIVKSIKDNKMTEGILSTIDKCAEILLDKGFQIEPDDKNELSNELRIKG